MPSPPSRKPPPKVLLESIEEEIEATFDLDALREDGLDPASVRARMAAKTAERIRRHLGGAREGTKEAKLVREVQMEHGRVDAVLSRPDGTMLIIEAKTAGIPDGQRYGLAALYTLDPEGTRGIESGMAYKSMVRAGFPDKWDSKKRSGQMQSVFAGLQRRGFASLNKRDSDGKKVARATMSGIQHLKAHEPELLAQFAKTHEGAERFF